MTINQIFTAKCVIFAPMEMKLWKCIRPCQWPTTYCWTMIRFNWHHYLKWKWTKFFLLYLFSLLCEMCIAPIRHISTRYARDHDKNMLCVRPPFFSHWNFHSLIQRWVCFHLLFSLIEFFFFFLNFRLNDLANCLKPVFSFIYYVLTAL